MILVGPSLIAARVLVLPISEPPTNLNDVFGAKIGLESLAVLIIWN